MYNNKRLALSIFWIVLGSVLLGLSIAEVINSSLYAGMGGGLIAVGGLQLAKNIRYRKNAAYREWVDTEAKDERNRFISMKSWSWAGYILVLVECIGIVAALIFGEETVQMVLSGSVCLLVFVYFVSYIILSRKY